MIAFGYCVREPSPNPYTRRSSLARFVVDERHLDDLDAQPVADDETTDDQGFDAEYPDDQVAEEAPAVEDKVSEGETPEEQQSEEASAPDDTVSEGETDSETSR